MDPINRLKAWKENISREDVIHWFTDKDHFKVGLDQGGSVIQIMNDLGFKNPHKDPMVELLGKMHMRSLINAARDYFERSGFIMSSRKFTKATPTVYFLIDNLSEERTERHLKIKVRACQKRTHKICGVGKTKSTLGSIKMSEAIPDPPETATCDCRRIPIHKVVVFLRPSIDPRWLVGRCAHCQKVHTKKLEKANVV